MNFHDDLIFCINDEKECVPVLVCHSLFSINFPLLSFSSKPGSQASPAIKPLKTGLPDYLDYNTGGKIRLRSSVVASWPEYFSCSQSKKK